LPNNTPFRHLRVPDLPSLPCDGPRARQEQTGAARIPA